MRVDRFLALFLAAAPAALLVTSAGCAGTVSGGVYSPDASGEIVVEEAPPAPRETVVYHRPGSVWITGRWVWDDGSWRWREGYWVRERPNQIYVQGYWDYDRGRHVWRDGRWEDRRRGEYWVEGRWVTNNGRAEWRQGYWSRRPVNREVRVYRQPARVERRTPSPPPAALPSDSEWRRRQDVREHEFDRSEDLRKREFEADLRKSDMTAAERRDARERYERQSKRREAQFASQQLKREKRRGHLKKRAANEELRD